MRRQLPKRRDLAPLLKFKRPTLSPKERRLASALTIEDLRRIAKRRTPKAAFDYTDGAADGEISLARARQAFADVEFHPAILRDVSTVDTSRVVLGQRVALPFGIAPTGFTRMMQTEGELAGAAAAGAAGSRSPCPRWAPPRSRRSRRPTHRIRRPQLVPALHVEGPRSVDGLGRPSRQGRVRHPRS